MLLFYCIFYTINAALVSKRDVFKKKKNLIIPQFLLIVYIVWIHIGEKKT